jgi:hypothetical protein
MFEYFKGKKISQKKIPKNSVEENYKTVSGSTLIGLPRLGRLPEN